MTRYQRRKLIAAGIIVPVRGLPPLPEPQHDHHRGGRPRLPFVSDKVERRRKQHRYCWMRRRMQA